MRLINISSIEINKDCFVEATRMLRADASNPQQRRHLNWLREQGSIVGLACKPKPWFTGKTTSTPSVLGHLSDVTDLSNAFDIAGDERSYLDGKVYGWPGTSTGNRGSNRFAYTGSLGFRDF